VTSTRLYPTQQRLWWLEQQHPGRQDFLVGGITRLRGDLSVAALSNALTEVVTRHESLRTGFRLAGAEPARFVIAPPASVLTQLGAEPAALPRQAEAVADEFCAKPFALSAPPLFRAGLIQCRPDEWLLAIAMHHIITDAYSCGIILHELAEFYNARVARRAPALTGPVHQYSEFVDHQLGWLQHGSAADQLSYWLQELRDYRPLRLARSPRATTSGRGQGHTVVFAADLCGQVRKFCRSNRCTPFMVMLGAVHVALHLYTGETDIALGSAMSNRVRTEYEGMVGYLRNIVVLRQQISAGMPFSQLLADVRDKVLAAYESQSVPFDHITHQMAGSPRQAETLYPQVFFCMDDSASGRWPLVSLSTDRLEREEVVSKRPLNLFFQDLGPCFALRCLYQPSVVGADDLAALSEVLQRVIIRIVANPQLRVKELAQDVVTPPWWPISPPMEASTSDQSDPGKGNPLCPLPAMRMHVWPERLRAAGMLRTSPPQPRSSRSATGSVCWGS
jgi:hypothetical protein